MARKVTIGTRKWTNGDGTEGRAYRVTYPDPAGGYDINRQFKKRSEAEEYRRQVEAELTNRTHVPLSRSPTVAEFANAWLEDGKLLGRLERATLVGREIKLRLHILPYLGDTKLVELTPTMVQEWLKRIAREPIPDELRKKDVRPGIRGLRSRHALGQALKHLRQMLKAALALELVGRNVAEAIELNSTSTRDQHNKIEAGVNFPTKQDVNSILSHAKGRYHPLLATFIYTGMRTSEIRGLTWDNVDFDEEVIRVRQRIDAYRQAGHPKSKHGNRDIPMLSQLTNILKAWKAVCPRHGGIATRFPTSEANALSVARLLKANPWMSDLQVARALHVGPHTAQVVRKDMGMPPFRKGTKRHLNKPIIWPLEVATDEELLSPGPDGGGRLHFVFPERGGKDLAHNTIYIELDRIQVELGLTNPERTGQYRGKYSPHDFRHFYVSLLADSGFSLQEVAEHVGHSATAMTLRYTHLFTKPAERRARLEEGFGRLRLVGAGTEKARA